MSRKNLLKKWGTYALGVMAVTGGMVAGDLIANNSDKVSAYSSSSNMYVLQARNISDSIYYNNRITALYHNGYDSSLQNYNAINFTVRIQFNAKVNWNSSDKFYINIDNVDFSNLDSFTYENNIEAVKSGNNYSSPSQTSYTSICLYSNEIKGINNMIDVWNNMDIFPFLDKFMLEIGKNAYEVQDEVDEGFELALGYDKSNDNISDATIGKLTYNETAGTYYYNSDFNHGGSGYSLQGMRYAGDIEFILKKMAYRDLVDYTLGGGEFTQEDIDNAYQEGAESVDITSDNESAINQYITDNNMKTEEEYNAYGEEQFNAGAGSVDITSDNESAINQYITDNNMKTESEYNAYGESQYQAGAESVDITSDNDGAINQYITDNNMKTEEEYNSYGESQYQAGTESVDITSDNEQSYNSGFQDAMDSFGKTEDSEGKYMYMFEMADRHGSVDTKSIVINEEQGKSNVLKTTLFLNINNNDGAVNHYGDSSYLINVDEILDFDNLRYSDIVRYGDKIVEDTGYVFSYSDVIFYSPSGKLVSFINNVDLENLSKQIMELIKVNELAELNEDMTNMRVNFSHTALDYFGNFVSIEQNYEGQEFVNVSSNGSIGIHVNSGRNLDFSVIRRSYDDVMYGVYGNGYSHDQYLEYGEEQFNAGAESVDITSDNESAINQYITDNNMKTEEEYNAYGEEQFNAGKEENANEYADRLNELDMTINNLNREIDNLNSKINDYETTDDKYQLGYENGRVDGELIGFNRGFEEALSKDLQTYGEEQFNKGYNSGLSIGFSNGYNQAQQEKDEEIGNIEQEKEDLVGQVESLQNDITGLNNRINELTGTINNMNGLLDKKYDEGFVAGAESVDITSDNEQIYQQGYFDGYTQCEIDNPPSVTYPENTYEFGFMEGYDAGLREGRESVDITIDNESAINQYITDNNMKTEEEYKNYGTSQYKAGAESVDITLDNESAVSKYLSDNNMKTEEEYNAYGEEKYSLGYKDNGFGKQVKRLGSSVGTFFINLGKGVVQYVAFGWLWDKSGRFSPAF